MLTFNRGNGWKKWSHVGRRLLLWEGSWALKGKDLLTHGQLQPLRWFEKMASQSHLFRKLPTEALPHRIVVIEDSWMCYIKGSVEFWMSMLSKYVFESEVWTWKLSQFRGCHYPMWPVAIHWLDCFAFYTHVTTAHVRNMFTPPCYFFICDVPTC